MATADYTAQADAFSKRVQWLIEIDLARCQEDFNSAPCTAAGGDGSRCYYSYQTCQDIANYNAATNTLRFCFRDVPWQDTAYKVYPYLNKFVAVPQRIDPAKLFVYPEQVKVEMACDWSPPAMDTDKALYNTGTAGEFWRNLLARNRNYAGRPLRIKRGFYADGFELADFLQIGPDYELKQVEVNGATCSITAESPLARLNKKSVPWATSNDNTLQAAVVAADTTFTVRDAAEYPDPADYTRNSIYVKVDNEICQVSSLDTGADTLTVVRARLGTTAVAHEANAKVQHVAFFGKDNGSADPSARNVVEVLQDLLEWADVASGDVDTTAFDVVSAGYWTDNDTYRIVSKSARISKHLQPLRETRGLIVFLDQDGKWSCKVMAPGDGTTLYTDQHFIKDSVSVSEDEEGRLTRVYFYYDPNTENPGSEPKDYNKAVIVINAGLEDANNYNGSKSREIFDAWISPTLPVSKVRNTARRLITRLRAGARTISFKLGVKYGTLNVGDSIQVQTRHILDRDGAEEIRPCIVVAKREVGRAVIEYMVLDTNFSGRYLRIGATTIAAGYDAATADDKTFGYYADTDNRVGSVKEPGYLLW